MPMTSHSAAANTDPRLQLEPPSGRTRFLFFLLCVVLPAGLSTVAMVLGGSSGNVFGRFMAGSMIATQLAGPLLITAFTSVLWWFLDWAMRRHRLSISDGVLTVKTSFYTDRIALSELLTDEARVIDIDEHPERKPLLKSNGYSVPGFISGWFRSRRFKKLFVATVGGKRLLWLPTTRGHTLLLQPRSPQALRDRLRELQQHDTHLQERLIAASS